MPELKVVVVSIISQGVGKDGGGFVIVNGKLRRIPPHSPKLKEIEVAVNLMAQAEDLADKRIRHQIAELSGSLIAARAGSLTEEFGK